MERSLFRWIYSYVITVHYRGSITNNKWKCLIVFVAFLLAIAVLSYFSLKSLPVRRARLITHPMPIPEYLTRVWPEPGSSTSEGDFNKSLIPHLGEICFTLENNFPGFDPDNLNLDIFQHFELRINDELPNAYLPDQAERFSIAPTGTVCWNVILQPGDYFVEVIIDGEMNLRYQWAFIITED